MTNTPTHVFGLIVSIGLVFSSCNDATPTSAMANDFEQLQSYFKTRHNYALSDSIRQIFVVSEKGCVSCNKNFAELTAKYINEPHTVVLISAEGSRVDVTPFLEERNNIFWENPASIASNHLLNKTSLICLSKNKVDTIITINADGIQEQFGFVKQRLDSELAN